MPLDIGRATHNPGPCTVGLVYQSASVYSEYCTRCARSAAILVESNRKASLPIVRTFAVLWLPLLQRTLYTNEELYNQYVLYAIPSLLASGMPKLDSKDRDRLPRRAGECNNTVWLVVRKRHETMRHFFLEDIASVALEAGCLAECGVNMGWNGIGQMVSTVSPNRIDYGTLKY